MLTDVILDEGFERNGEWYDPQDLERDLHLAAELGKTLLARNHKLEQALQQMYSTNQEQLLEIEHMTKQVELLRQTNHQHAKVYEQLEATARDLEQDNQRLVRDNRLAQQKIHSLTEAVEGLQSYMEELHSQVDELRTAQAERRQRELAEQRRSLVAQSVSCLKELYDRGRRLSDNCLPMDGPWSPNGSLYKRDGLPDPEEENAALQRAVQSLQTQIRVERSRREGAERERELTVQENRGLEQRLDALAPSLLRQEELEAQVEQLRLQWRADCANSRRRPEQLLLPDTVFFGSEDRAGAGQEEPDRGGETEEEQRTSGRPRCNSDGVLKATHPEDIRRAHERMCIRRSEAVKQRGVSLLNEVDAQYSALQVKYEELLRRCQQAADEPSHKSVQTPGGPPTGGTGTRQPPSSSSSSSSSSSTQLLDPKPAPEEDHQPEYKSLFSEIFTRIQQTKEDLGENRHLAE